jgi:hypothetical protein
MSRTTAGLNMIYNGGLTSTMPMVGGGRRRMHGGGFLSSLKNGLTTANQWAKNNKIVTNGDSVIRDLGLHDKANHYTGGYYDKFVNVAKKHGYGRRKRTSGSKSGAGRKRKTGGRRKRR